ncbi:hypothetical protein ABT160_20410 [Streptomyces sp. NPDC001941]|uniref:DUF6924 domain-containing protein n=1 Tax=Streptomyces sp. NPDC001941 TaxID=3154659 RepID=UPI00331668FC
MSALPEVTGREEFDALVVRTSYGDEQAWRDITEALAQPWGDGLFEACVHLVDDPVWSGATADEVVTALSDDEELPVVFLADRASMDGDHHPLLAVTTLTREECVDEEDYEQLVRFGREFRTTPAGVHDVHANLSTGNIGFEEFAESAGEDPEGIYRSV